MVIGIIGAMDAEVAALKQKMNIESTEVISGIEFCKGALCGKSVVVAKCGVGHSSILAWIIPWTGKPGRPQFMGSQRVRHN